MRRTRAAKARKASRLIALKEKLTAELSQAQKAGGYQIESAIAGVQEEVYANILTAKLADRSQHLKDMKRNYEQQISRIASVKTGLTTLTAKLRQSKLIRHRNSQSLTNETRNKQNDLMLQTKALLEKFRLLKRNVELKRIQEASQLLAPHHSALTAAKSCS